jgi:hypothetical protein
VADEPCYAARRDGDAIFVVLDLAWNADAHGPAMVEARMEGKCITARKPTIDHRQQVG